jgi:phosphatidylglycerophosphatase C
MPDVAAFDLDGTLTEGGSTFAFLIAVAGRRTVSAAVTALAPHLFHAALAGGSVADTTKEQLFGRALAGVTVDRLDEVSRTFAAHHVHQHLRSDVFRRYAWHQRRGDHLVIVSASLDSYVAPIGALLHADQVLATRLAVEDGRLTGRYEGRNCRGEEKLRRLQEWIDQLGEDTPRLWAYGNSRGDLRMLRAADVGVNVGRLGRWGKLSSFPGLAGSAGG